MNSFFTERFKKPLAGIAGIILISSIPFLLVAAFPSLLYCTMNTASYLVFHNTAEFFSAMVSFSIFGLGWYAYDRSSDAQSLFLAAAFLVIGILDFMHALSYSGMPDFITPNVSSKASQLWIAARLFTAAVFLASGFLYPDKSPRWMTKSSLLCAAAAVIALVFTCIIFFPEKMPATFIEGKGLTPFKKYSEYLIITLFILSAAVYRKRRKTTGDRIIIYYTAAFVLCIFCELVFTFYKSVFDTYNLLGHVYKIAAFCLIYRGIFIADVYTPYEQLISANGKLLAEIAERQKAEGTVRQALLEKETLLRELNHRTKNTMQVIMGMIRLKAVSHEENLELQDLVKTTGDRIQAISLVHQMLYTAQDLSRISIKEYIQALSSLIFRSFDISNERIRLTIDADDQLCLLDTAIPFGLILNELITNSLKYAFPCGRNGVISITLKQTNSGSSLFCYSDNGVGVPEGFDFRKQDSLGFKLIYGIGEQQLHGQVSIEKDEGIRCSIEFTNNLYKERV